MLRDCDCGACCETCGHDAGFIRSEGLMPVPSDAELEATAKANPSSFLAFLLSEPDGGQA